MKILLKIAFVGTNYCGWQAQVNGRSVQQTLTTAAERLFGFPCDITGCSRTDSGVHALEYLATLEPVGSGARIPVERIPKALAHALPPDISVMEALEVADDFAVRRAVKGKEYMYIYG